MSVLFPFTPLHALHAHCVFAYVWPPPRDSGMRWSSSGALLFMEPRAAFGVSLPHIWQRQPSRSNTREGLMLSIALLSLALRSAFSAALLTRLEHFLEQ